MLLFIDTIIVGFCVLLLILYDNHCMLLVIISVIIASYTSDISMSQFLFLWQRIGSNSLLVFFGWVEPSSIKGGLQTAKDLGAPPLAWWWLIR